MPPDQEGERNERKDEPRIRDAVEQDIDAEEEQDDSGIDPDPARLCPEPAQPAIGLTSVVREGPDARVIGLGLFGFQWCIAPLDIQRIASHRLVDALDLLFTHEVEPDRDLLVRQVMHGAGDDDATRLGQLLQPCRDVHAIAVDVLTVQHDVAEVHADAKLQGSGRQRVLRRDGFLDVDGAAHGFNDRCKLGNHCIAPGIYLTTLMLVEQFRHDFAAAGECRHCSLFVCLHEASEADAVGAKDCRELAFQEAPRGFVVLNGGLGVPCQGGAAEIFAFAVRQFVDLTGLLCASLSFALSVATALDC